MRHTGGPLIGNDIVDLQFFERPARRPIKYLSRVCTAAEAMMVRRSENPCMSLEVVWAAKEAAFKLVSKELKVNHFVPREFETAWGGSHSQDLHVLFNVSYFGIHIAVTVSANEEWAHAIATFPQMNVLARKVARIDEGCGDQSAVGDESAAARSLARQLLAECGREETLEFEGRIPVLKGEHGRASELGGSLSHHGRYAAVAIGGSRVIGGWPVGMVQNSMQVTSSREQCSTCMA